MKATVVIEMTDQAFRDWQNGLYDPDEERPTPAEGFRDLVDGIAVPAMQTEVEHIDGLTVTVTHE